MAKAFTEIRMLDNFYQTSSFFPMPVVLISTLNENGSTNLGPYSLCFPYVVTGGEKYSMLLIALCSSLLSCSIAVETTKKSSASGTERSSWGNIKIPCF